MARPKLRTAMLVLSAVPYLIGLHTFGEGSPVQGVPSYSKDIAPIFKAHCYSCHQGGTSAAGLDLSTPEGIQKGGVSGKLFVTGKPEASLLMSRVEGKGGLPQMPMGFAPLTKAQLQKLSAWIKAGAKLDKKVDQHWAYVRPTRPAVPKVVNSKWVRNPIDAFIVARLEKGALRPSPEASAETLARRVSLDLIGLPPVGNASASTYEEMIDQLLKSKHFGEHQARSWLDLARYADSNGYEADHARTAWKYRDWVIDAFNKNMPFDQFTIAQLAGDLLPQPSIDQLIATGFHRNTMLNLEGGVDPKEARYEMINDRVATTSQVWLGQTMQCARCHDHKYDPISQKDYFRMYAVFSNTTFESRGDPKIGQEKYYEPSIKAPSEEQSKLLAKLESEVRTLEGEMKASSPSYVEEKSAFFARAKAGRPWRNAEVSGAQLKSEAAFALRPVDDNPATVVYRVQLDAPAGARALKLRALPDSAYPGNGPGRSSGGNFILSRLSISADGKPIKLVAPVASYVQGGYSLEGLFDSDGESGWAIAPRMGQEHWLIVRFDAPLPSASKLDIEIGHESGRWAQHSLGKFGLQVSTESDYRLQAIPEEVSRALSQPSSPETEKLLDNYFRGVSENLAPVRVALTKAQAAVEELNKQIPMAMVMREQKSTGQLTTPLRVRGEFLQPGPMVTAGIPLAFGKVEAPRVDRLALAKWLVDKRNPLTARVQVNRIWEQYFGRGLVETSENWGLPGTPPSHPELLDWLACEFMDSGWDMKHIHGLIVTSATYRQSSRTTPALQERDPTNRLLTRGPRYRMSAEMIRDNALAIAGILSPKVGGPSVFPHQPDGVWNTPYSGERWTTSAGGDLYRRGLYTFWKRTATYPTFVNFDAPTREACTVRRERTNTPLQALNLLNDPAYLAAAKAYGNKILALDLGDQNRLVAAFQGCTGRAPKADELARLQTALDNLRTKYHAAPTEAAKLAGDPERAAWTMLASILLNLDETITKE